MFRSVQVDDGLPRSSFWWRHWEFCCLTTNYPIRAHYSSHVTSMWQYHTHAILMIIFNAVVRTTQSASAHISYDNSYAHFRCHVSASCAIRNKQRQRGIVNSTLLAQCRYCNKLGKLYPLFYYRLKYLLMGAWARTERWTLQWMFQQPMLIEPNLDSVNILDASNEPLCCLRIYLHWKTMFCEI